MGGGGGVFPSLESDQALVGGGLWWVGVTFNEGEEPNQFTQLDYSSRRVMGFSI